MKKNAACLIFLLIGLNLIFAQQKKDNGLLNPFNEERNQDYFTYLKFSNRLKLIQNFETIHFGTYSKLEFPVLFKYNLMDKVSLLVGGNLTIMNNGITGKVSDAIYGTFGIEYEVRENMLLEARMNYKLYGKDIIITDFASGSEPSFTIGSKLKF